MPTSPEYAEYLKEFHPTRNTQKAYLDWLRNYDDRFKRPTGQMVADPNTGEMRPEMAPISLEETGQVVADVTGLEEFARFNRTGLSKLVDWGGSWYRDLVKGINLDVVMPTTIPLRAAAGLGHQDATVGNVAGELGGGISARFGASEEDQKMWRHMGEEVPVGLSAFGLRAIPGVGPALSYLTMYGMGASYAADRGASEMGMHLSGGLNALTNYAIIKLARPLTVAAEKHTMGIASKLFKDAQNAGVVKAVQPFVREGMVNIAQSGVGITGAVLDQAVVDTDNFVEIMKQREFWLPTLVSESIFAAGGTIAGRYANRIKFDGDESEATPPRLPTREQVLGKEGVDSGKPEPLLEQAEFDFSGPELKQAEFDFGETEARATLENSEGSLTGEPSEGAISPETKAAKGIDPAEPDSDAQVVNAEQKAVQQAMADLMASIESKKENRAQRNPLLRMREEAQTEARRLVEPFMTDGWEAEGGRLKVLVDKIQALDDTVDLTNVTWLDLEEAGIIKIHYMGDVGSGKVRVMPVDMGMAPHLGSPDPMPRQLNLEEFVDQFTRALTVGRSVPTNSNFQKVAMRVLAVEWERRKTWADPHSVMLDILADVESDAFVAMRHGSAKKYINRLSQAAVRMGGMVFEDANDVSVTYLPEAKLISWSRNGANGAFDAMRLMDRDLDPQLLARIKDPGARRAATIIRSMLVDVFADNENPSRFFIGGRNDVHAQGTAQAFNELLENLGVNEALRKTGTRLVVTDTDYAAHAARTRGMRSIAGLFHKPYVESPFSGRIGDFHVVNIGSLKQKWGHRYALHEFGHLFEDLAESGAFGVEVRQELLKLRQITGDVEGMEGPRNRGMVKEALQHLPDEAKPFTAEYKSRQSERFADAFRTWVLLGDNRAVEGWAAKHFPRLTKLFKQIYEFFTGKNPVTERLGRLGYIYGDEAFQAGHLEFMRFFDGAMRRIDQWQAKQTANEASAKVNRSLRKLVPDKGDLVEPKAESRELPVHGLNEAMALYNTMRSEASPGGRRRIEQTLRRWLKEGNNRPDQLFDELTWIREVNKIIEIGPEHGKFVPEYDMPSAQMLLMLAKMRKVRNLEYELIEAVGKRTIAVVERSGDGKVVKRYDLDESMRSFAKEWIKQRDNLKNVKPIMKLLSDELSIDQHNWQKATRLRPESYRDTGMAIAFMDMALTEWLYGRIEGQNGVPMGGGMESLRKRIRERMPKWGSEPEETLKHDGSWAKGIKRMMFDDESEAEAYRLQLKDSLDGAGFRFDLEPHVDAKNNIKFSIRRRPHGPSLFVTQYDSGKLPLSALEYGNESLTGRTGMRPDKIAALMGEVNNSDIHEWLEFRIKRKLQVAVDKDNVPQAVKEIVRRIEEDRAKDPFVDDIVKAYLKKWGVSRVDDIGPEYIYRKTKGLTEDDHYLLLNLPTPEFRYYFNEWLAFGADMAKILLRNDDDRMFHGWMPFSPSSEAKKVARLHSPEGISKRDMKGLEAVIRTAPGTMSGLIERASDFVLQPLARLVRGVENLHEHTLGNLGHMAESDPKFRAPADAIVTEQNVQNEFANQTLSPLYVRGTFEAAEDGSLRYVADPSGALDKFKGTKYEGRGTLAYVVSKPDLLDIYNKLALLENEFQQKIHGGDKPELKAQAAELMKDLPPDQVLALDHMLARKHEVQRVHIKERFRLERRINLALTAHSLKGLSTFGGSAEQALAVARVLDDLDRAGKVKLLVDSGLSHEDAIDFAIKHDGMKRVTDDAEAQLAATDWYSTEARMKQYQVPFVVKEPGARFQQGMRDFETMEGALAFMQELKESKDAYATVKTPINSWARRGRIVAQRGVQEILQQVVAQRAMVIGIKLGEAGVDPGLMRMVETTVENIGPAVSVELRHQELLQKTRLHRKFRAGREHLDMIDQQQQQMWKVGTSLSRKYTDLIVSLFENDEEIQKQPFKVKKLSDARDAIRTPDPLAQRRLSKAAFTIFMGGNISTALIEAFQFWLTLSHVLVAKGADYVSAFKIPAKMLGVATQAALKRLQKGEAGTFDIWKGDHGELIRLAERQNRLAVRRYIDVDDDTMRNFLELYSAMRTGHGNIGRAAKGVGQLAYRAMNRTYGFFNRINAELSIVSAYEVLKKQHPHMGKPQLFEEAMRLFELSNGAGGRGMRPDQLFGTKTWLGRVGAQGIWSLQSYANAVLAMELGMLKKALNYKGEGGFSRTEVKNARRGIALSLGVKTTGLGVFGYPLVGGIAKIIEGVFGYDPEEEFRNWIAGPDPDDDDIFLSEAASMGLLYASDSIPMDVQGRLAVTGLGPINSFEGFDTTNIFGPIGSHIAQALRVKRSLDEGNTTMGKAAIEMFLPTGLRRAAKLMLDDGEVYDSRNSWIMTPTTGEAAAMFLGFTPRFYRKELKRRAELYEAQRSESKYRMRDANEAARLMMAGATNEAERLIKQSAMSQDGISTREMANAAITSYQRMMYGRPDASGSGQPTEQAARLFRNEVRKPRPPDSDLYMERTRMLNEMGIPTLPSPTSYGRYALMDMIKGRTPYLPQGLRAAGVRSMRPQGPWDVEGVTELARPTMLNPSGPMPLEAQPGLSGLLGQ